MTQRQGFLTLFVIMLSLALSVFAQSGTDQVRLFESYFFDTPIAKTNHVQPGLVYKSYDGFSWLTIGANGGYVVNEKLEVLGSLGYLSWSPEKGDGQSGLSDLALYARYKLSTKKETQFSAGGMLTLPIGSEDVGQSNFNFGGYAAIRHLLKNGMVITGNVALLFEEAGDDRESSLELGGGVIYPVDKKMNIVGELTIKSDKDYMLLSGGVDYNMGNGRLRGGIGLGLDDNAPDWQIMGGYLLTL